MPGTEQASSPWQNELNFRVLCISSTSQLSLQSHWRTWLEWTYHALFHSLPMLPSFRRHECKDLWNLKKNSLETLGMQSSMYVYSDNVISLLFFFLIKEADQLNFKKAKNSVSWYFRSSKWRFALSVCLQNIHQS